MQHILHNRRFLAPPALYEPKPQHAVDLKPVPKLVLPKLSVNDPIPALISVALIGGLLWWWSKQ